MPLSDSWKTTSGLLEEYEMTLGEVWFGKDPQYQDGKATIFIVRGDAELNGELLEEEKRNFYSVGDGWEPDDGGDTVKHGSGKTQFNANSSFGKFITHAIEALGDGVEEFAERGETYEADTWRDTRWRFERKTFEFNDRETKEKREYSVELPVEFLGYEDGEEEAPAPKAPRSRGKTAAKAEEKAAPAAGSRRRKKEEPAEEEADEPAPAKGRRRSAKKEDDGGLRDEVIAFAAEWEEHGDFMDTVLDPSEFPRAAEVNSNEELLNDILDAAGSIWTASRAL